MTELNFDQVDATLIWVIPKNGCDLLQLIKTYTFIDRTSPPSFEAVHACLSKAIMAGMVKFTTHKTYHVSDYWYNVIHQFDQCAKNEFEAISELEDYLYAGSWPSENDSVFDLTRGEYDWVLKHFI